MVDWCDQIGKIGAKSEIRLISSKMSIVVLQKQR